MPSLVAGGRATEVKFEEARTDAHTATRKSTIFLKEELNLILTRLKRLVVTNVNIFRARFVHWIKPSTSSLPLGGNLSMPMA